MAVIQKNSDTQVESQSEKKSQYRVVPRYGLWTEDDKVVMQIALPGVQKDAIQMKALEDYFQLRAKRETIEYVLDLEFGMKVEPEHTKAVYEEGLLRLEFKKYKPLEHAYEVPIQ